MPSTELWLRDDFRELWRGQDPFVAAFAIEGEIFRALEQRQTLAFSAQGKRYFIKRHRGATWKEILKNLLQGRLPVISAKNEFEAIGKLQALGLRVPVAAAYGRRGLLPSTFESFLVTEDVGPHQNLEEYCQGWRKAPPSWQQKQQLLAEVAAISRTMHGAGICHRDFYLCHLLRTTPEQPLTVIDLHRALIKAPLAKRWIIKDLAGLYFSALNIGLTRRDLYRFMRQYRGGSLRATLQDDAAFWRAVVRRAVKLYARDQRAAPPSQ